MHQFFRWSLRMLLVVLCLIGVLGWYALREIGQSPTEEELKSYEHLPYFQNGEFQSPKKMVYDFNNVRNGPASFWRFLTRSKYAPAFNLPHEPLNQNSFPFLPNDFDFYWLGHSSVIMEVNGVRLLIDPVFGNAAPIPFAVPRYNAAPLEVSDLPPLDYVIITHNHYDHLERKTIQALKDSHFIVPLGVGAALRGWGVPVDHITELGWNDSFQKDNLKITAHTAVHYSGRGLKDRNKTLWNSYVIQTPDKNIFWSGDSGYGEHFVQIGQQYGSFDLAVIEIDGWNTGWPNTHLFPNEAVQAAIDLRARQIIPVHWGVFDLALHPWDESIDMVVEQAESKGIQVITPKMGVPVDLNMPDTSYWWKNL